MVMSFVVDGLRMRVSVRKTELPVTLPTTESQTSFENALLVKISRDTRTRAVRRICFLLSVARFYGGQITIQRSVTKSLRRLGGHEALIHRPRSLPHAAPLRADAPRGE